MEDQDRMGRAYEAVGEALRERLRTTSADDVARLDGVRSGEVVVVAGAFGAGELEWWRVGVPVTVRKECAVRREEDPEEPCEVYCYTNLLDLGSIVERNWVLFKDRLGDRYSAHKRPLLEDLKRLNRIRNRVMHPVRGSVPTEEDFDFLRGMRHQIRSAKEIVL
jgi:hypothetical protein